MKLELIRHFHVAVVLYSCTPFPTPTTEPAHLEWYREYKEFFVTFAFQATNR